MGLMSKSYSRNGRIIDLHFLGRWSWIPPLKKPSMCLSSFLQHFFKGLKCISKCWTFIGAPWSFRKDSMLKHILDIAKSKSYKLIGINCWGRYNWKQRRSMINILILSYKKYLWFLKKLRMLYSKSTSNPVESCTQSYSFSGGWNTQAAYLETKMRLCNC